LLAFQFRDARCWVHLFVSPSISGCRMPRRLCFRKFRYFCQVQVKTLLFYIVISTSIIFLGCGEDHVITNPAVELKELKYNRSHDYCIVTYILDVGARGERLYKSLLKTKDLDGNLLKGHLPTGIENVQWLNNRTVNVEYNSSIESLNASGNQELIPLFQKRDTVQVGEIKFLVVSREKAASN